jgi:hypothetical protein
MTDALTRARQLLARSELPRTAGLPAVRAPGPELIRYVKNCSVHVRPFLVVAEAHGDRLRMRRNEPMPGGGGNSGGPVSSVPSLGSFSFDAADWAGCPHCGARDNPAHNLHAFWMCGGCGGFNCTGDRGGYWRCACGTVATSFTTVEKFEVRGMRGAVGATPPRASPAPAMRPAPFVAPAPAPRFTGPSLPAPEGPPPLRLPGRK